MISFLSAEFLKNVKLDFPAAAGFKFVSSLRPKVLLVKHFCVLVEKC
jgi:hypothetical protein